MLTAATTSACAGDPNGTPGTIYREYKQLKERSDKFTQYTSANMDDPIVINVGGKKFETYEETLARFPETLLGSPTRRAKFYNQKRREYFFDRHRSAFDGILYYYQSGGTLIRQENVPPHVFANEVIFFDMPESAVQNMKLEAGIVEQEEEKPMPTNRFLKAIWNVLEYPESSKLAKILAIFSVCVISVSLIIFCVETLPTFNPTYEPPANASASWEPPENPYTQTWFTLNTIVIAWFTSEYVLRFIASPMKWNFLVGVLNIIDLLSILPYYVTLAIGSEGGSAISVLRVVRVVRVFRVFKLSRHSRGLQILGNTLRASLNELIMLMFFLFIGVMIFGSCVYYAEGGKDSEGFPSIPHSFWWAVVTMTTVGYGDVSPSSFAGKMVGALCAISGVLTIALPVPVIVSNFENFYNKEINRRKEEEMRKAEAQRAKKEANESKKNSVEMERIVENDSKSPRDVLVDAETNDEYSAMLNAHSSV